MREYVVVFLVAAAVTYLLTVVAREIAVRTGAVAKVRDRDVHAEPVPYLGGLAMLGGLFAAFIVARELPFLSGSLAFVFDDALAVLVAGALVCAVGVLDDIFDLDALTKFGGQVVAVGVLVYLGVQFRFFYQPDGVSFALDPAQGALLTAFVVIATMNAVNFIDGLDGLAAGVIGIGAAAFFVFCYLLTVVNDVDRATTASLLSAALAGACTGFLAHNFHPARIFMGDSGSMLIGLVLSSSAVTMTTQYSDVDLNAGIDGARANLLPMLLPMALPILIMVVPLADLVLAVLRRTAARRSPFAPDKQHLHHRLLEIGHSHRRAVVIMWMWAALVGFGTVFVSLLTGRAVVLGATAGLVLTIAVTFITPNLGRPAIVRRQRPVATPDAEPPQTL